MDEFRMPGMLVRFRPTGPWRIGPDSGARDRVDHIFHSDALYSAVCSAMGQLGTLEDWLAATAGAEGEPAVRLSSCFPWQEDELFVVPPRNLWPPPPSPKVRWKGARFVPLSLVSLLLAEKPLDEERWAVDPASECLLPTQRRFSTGPFRVAVRSSAAVDRLSPGATELHATACLEFAERAGMWCAIGFADEEARRRWSGPLKSALRLLADSGMGGERSRGWGRSLSPSITEGSIPTLLLPKLREPKPAPKVVVAGAPEVPEKVVSATVEPIVEAADEVAPAVETVVEAPVEAAVAEVVAEPIVEEAAEPAVVEAAPEPVVEAAPEPDDPDIRTASVREDIIEPMLLSSIDGDDPPPDVPAVEEPTVDEPVVDEPLVEESAVEEPAVEEPAVEEPAVEEPAVEEPAVEEPSAEEPAAEATPEEPAVAPPAPVVMAKPVEPAAPAQPPTAWWLLSLFTPAASDAIDWKRGNYTMLTRAGRVESAAKWGELKKSVRMVGEGSVLLATAPPSGAAPNVAPEGFPHPVYRSGLAFAIPIPWRNSQ
jgi:CRISPR type III-A-associated RAMP protein Csm4